MRTERPACKVKFPPSPLALFVVIASETVMSLLACRTTFVPADKDVVIVVGVIVESLEGFVPKTAEIIGVKNIGIGSDLCINHPDSVVEWMRNGTWTKTKNYGEGSENKPGFPKQPDWFLDARGFNNLEIGLNKIGFNEDETNGILGNNWYNFYKGIS